MIKFNVTMWAFPVLILAISSCVPRDSDRGAGPVSKNSWDELRLENYQDVPPEWKYVHIPETPFEIPLPTTSVIERTGPLLEIFSLPQDESGAKHWNRDFGIELAEVLRWNSSLKDYIRKLYEQEVRAGSVIQEGEAYYNEHFNSLCTIMIYRSNGIETNDRLGQCVPGRYEYSFLHEGKVYRFVIWFDEHAGAQAWANLALRNIRVAEKHLLTSPE